MNDRVVVIGSGPAGATAASFLCRKGVKVTLLEAGSRRSALGLTLRVRGVTLAKMKRDLRARSGISRTGATDAVVFEDLAPGGLSNHWSCAVPRFSPEDFADAERAGEEQRWPFGYEELARWYGEVEPLLHIAGSDADLPHLPACHVRHRRELPRDWTPLAAGAAAFGRDLGPMPYAFGADTTLTLSGTPFNAFTRLIRGASRTGNLEVRYDARAVSLEWSSQRGRVEAVVYRNAYTGAEVRLPCRAVVVAGGTINTAQLLLESTSRDFPNGLGNTHGVLGRYLHDHPIGKLVLDLGRPVPIHTATYLTRLPLDKAKPLYAAACMQWSGAQVMLRSVLRGQPGRMSWIGFSVFGAMVPSRDNFVEPDRTKPPGIGALKLHIRHEPPALHVLEEAREQLLQILTQAGWSPRVRVWKIEAPGHSNHYGGTCRMHADPRYGMLDAYSRVHGVPNVMVADSSAFTTGPEKNPVLTAMALSARASDRLAADLAAGRC